MKKYRNLIAMIIIISVQACASVHDNIAAEKVDGPLHDSKTISTTATGIRISGGLNYSMESKYFRAIDFTFENTTGSWLRITDISLDFADEKLNRSITVPIGQDIVDWVNATNLNNRISSYNKDMLLSGLVLVGAIAGMQGNSSSQQSGNLMLSGGVSAMAADSINKGLDAVQNAKLIPTNHLLSVPFAIPPGLFVKKWVLLHTSVPDDIEVPALYIHYQLTDGRKESVKLPIQFFSGIY
jgi:hypothetical protein